MSRIASSLRQLARRLARRPGLTLTAVAVLALGIGANVAIFSAVQAVLLRPLPYPEPERLVAIEETGQDGLNTLSPPNFMDLRARADALSALAAYFPGGFSLSGQDLPAELVSGTYVSEDFFRVMGAAPVLGRPFEGAELAPGGPPAVVLSDALWRRRYGADPRVVGRQVEIDGGAMRIVGVMPAGFEFPAEAELWAARGFSDEELTTQRGAHYLSVVGRLARGATIEQAAVQASTLAGDLAAEYPRTNHGRGFEVEELRESLIGDARPALWMLAGAVGLVLVVACLNVGSLMLARSVERLQELSIRSALGAATGRMVGQVLAEGLALAGLGAAAALIVARLGVAALAPLEELGLPRLSEARLDLGALAFGLALALAAALAAAGLPALRLATSRRLYSALGGAGRGTGDRTSQRLRSALVVAEAALAVVLVFGAGLLGRSFWKLQDVDPGFDPNGVLTFNLALNDSEYPEPERRAAFVDELLERVEAQPGVNRAGAVFGLPQSGFNYSISVERLDGAPAYDAPGTEESVQIRAVTPGYLEAMGIPLVAGRAPSEGDRAGAPPVVWVNAAAARILWPGEDPLGHTMEVGTRLIQDGERRAGGEVVGVIGDLLHDGLAGEPLPELYVAQAQYPTGFFTVVVDGPGDPAALAGAMRDLVQEMDPRLPLFQVLTMEQRMSAALAENRLYALLLGLFAATALALAVVGLYGLMAYAASQRVREVGIRMALGASRKRILGWMLRQGLALTAAGVALGALAALGASELLSSWLFGLDAQDPLTLGAAVLLLLAAGLGASLSPARSATRVDPVESLKRE